MSIERFHRILQEGQKASPLVEVLRQLSRAQAPMRASDQLGWLWN